MKINISKLIIFIVLIGFTHLTFADPASSLDVGVFGQINQNTSDIADHEARIDVLESVPPPVAEPVYNYKDYLADSNITSRTYQYYFPTSATCNREIQEISRIDNGDGTKTVIMKRTRDNQYTAFICSIRIFNYLATADAFQFLGIQNLDRNDGTTILGTVTYNPPFPLRKSQMKVGDSWSHAPDATVTDIPYPVPVTHVLRNTTFEGIEDVTVPAGSYTGCIKMYTRKLAIELLEPSFDDIKWYCSGIGLVKRTIVFNDGQRSLQIKLSGVTTTP